MVYGNVSGSGTPLLPGLAPGNVTISDRGGGNVAVNVTYAYQPMIGPTLPGFGFGSGSVPLNFNMLIAVTMRAIS